MLILKGSDSLTRCVVVLVSMLLEAVVASDSVVEVEPDIVTSQNGSSAMLHCPYNEDDADKRPLLWLFNSTIISTNTKSYLDKVKPFMTSGRVQGLEIREVMPKHEGSYYCSVPGAFTKTFNLVVTYQPQITYYSPNLSKVLTREGSFYSMECRAAGKPEPSIIWIKKDPHYGQNITLLVNTTILTLNNLTKNDRGMYVCEAHNGVGSPDRHFFDIHVAYRPVILHTSEDLHIGIGHNVSIQCVVNSNPAPQVTWHMVDDHNTLLDHVITHEGELDGGHTVSSRLSFWRVQRSDEGEYICRGQNDLDVAEKRVRLKGSPHDLVITSRMMGEDTNTYYISWQVVSLSKLEELEIILMQIPDETFQYSQELDSLEYPIVLNGIVESGVRYAPARNRTIRDWVGSRNAYIIEDLIPDTEYELKMRVANAFGFSQWTKEFRFRTAEAVQNDEHLEPSPTFLVPTMGEEASMIKSVDYGNSSGMRLLTKNLLLQVFVTFLYAN